MLKPPTFDSLMNPLLNSLRQLGGSGSVEEIYEKVVETEQIPDEVLAQLHDPDRSTQTEVAYRLAWARTYLRKLDFIENSSRGVWALTPKGRATSRVDPADVLRSVRALLKSEKSATKSQDRKDSDDAHRAIEIVDEQEVWRAKLHHILTSELDAGAFERLTQRLLRESGFVSVEVTGRTGDGGIDGKGIARINGLMSFHVIFQCKKYKGSVSPSEIRDFRGAMVGRADKGLFITTGTFTPAAIKEATRDGAPPIDLIDGVELANKLKELGLGVKREMVEEIAIDAKWFLDL